MYICRPPFWESFLQLILDRCRHLGWPRVNFWLVFRAPEWCFWWPTRGRHMARKESEKAANGLGDILERGEAAALRGIFWSCRGVLAVFRGKFFFLRVGASSGDLQWVEEEILGRVRDIHYCWGELVDIFLEAGRILGRVLKLEQEVFLEVWVSWRSEISWGSKLHREFLRESLQTEEEKFVLWSHQKHHFESGAFSFLKIPLHSLLI